MKLNKAKQTKKTSITVGFLHESNRDRLRLTSLTGDIGFAKEIKDKNVHRPGLALAGYVDLFRYDRIQIFGNTEMRYLEHLEKPRRLKSLQTVFEFDLPCVVVTNDNPVEEEMLAMARERQVPVLKSSFESTKFIYILSDFLDDQFSPQTVVHGSFVDIYGIGVLLTGRSGIGKSEIALDLVERGHRLVADDVVMITQKGEGILMGAGTDLVKHFMEIRGLGLIDVRSMFGIRAIRFQKRVEIVIELMEWRPDEDYTRTGLDDEGISILDVQIPHVRLPIFPGKNVTVICEVIALNYLLKHYGYDAAKEFTKRLEAVITEKTKHIGERAIDYFEHDFE
ncbi:MAG TPA: HPr(Ser) kinase/phosphatase [Bacteroidota bacterium]|jgi:HPr kinase/phosphorylase|nr:HPr(Ser) kinase/phosphatase [Bacteroidota bacterium]